MEIKGFKDTIDWYDANAEQYGEGAKRVGFAESVKAFLEKLPEHPSVLEAGCGTGRDARVFKDMGADVTGVDISEGLLKVAREENPDVTFVSGDLTSLPFSNGSFDGVWSHASLVHMETTEDAKKALSEFFRVLRPGGFLYVYVKEKRGEKETDVVSDTLSNHDRFFRYYTPEGLSELLSEAGFEKGESVLQEDPHGRTEVRWIKTIVRKS